MVSDKIGLELIKPLLSRRRGAAWWEAPIKCLRFQLVVPDWTVGASCSTSTALIRHQCCWGCAKKGTQPLNTLIKVISNHLHFIAHIVHIFKSMVAQRGLMWSVLWTDWSENLWGSTWIVSPTIPAHIVHPTTIVRTGGLKQDPDAFLQGLI